MTPRILELVNAAVSRIGPARGVVIPPGLVLAIIAQESSGNTLAKRLERNGQWARGLMQVLESTAREQGLRNPQALHEPAVGIDQGVTYLARQLARYRGNVSDAVAAYNAGSALRNASGQYVNAGYVREVLARWKRSSAPAVPALGGVIVGLIALSVLLRTRARRSRGGA